MSVYPQIVIFKLYHCPTICVSICLLSVCLSDCLCVSVYWCAYCYCYIIPLFFHLWFNNLSVCLSIYTLCQTELCLENFGNFLFHCYINRRKHPFIFSCFFIIFLELLAFQCHERWHGANNG